MGADQPPNSPKATDFCCCCCATGANPVRCQTGLENLATSGGNRGDKRGSGLTPDLSERPLFPEGNLIRLHFERGREWYRMSGDKEGKPSLLENRGRGLFVYARVNYLPSAGLQHLLFDGVLPGRSSELWGSRLRTLAARTDGGWSA